MPNQDTECKHCNELIYWDKEYAQWYHIYEGSPQKRCILPPQVAEPQYKGQSHEIRQGYVVTVRVTNGHNNHLITHRLSNAEDLAPYLDAPNTDVYEIIKRPYDPAHA